MLVVGKTFVECEKYMVYTIVFTVGVCDYNVVLMWHMLGAKKAEINGVCEIVLLCRCFRHRH